MNAFKNGGYDRKGFNIKPLRNDLMMLMECDKPWEVVVGQTIGQTDWANLDHNDDALGSYLGEKVVNSILRR